MWELIGTVTWAYTNTLTWELIGTDDRTGPGQHQSHRIPKLRGTIWFNNCIAKGRIIKEAAFRPDDEWYVSGSKLDGTGTHSWWGGCDDAKSKAIKEWIASDLQVAFGSTMFGTPSYVLIKDENGYRSQGIDNDLIVRIKRINNNTGTIHYVRLFSSGVYFISDSEATEWKGLGIYLA